MKELNLSVPSYFKNEIENIYARTEPKGKDSFKGFIKQDGAEKEVRFDNKLLNDTLQMNDQISEEEYNNKN